jgi:serralysin
MLDLANSFRGSKPMATLTLSSGVEFAMNDENVTNTTSLPPRTATRFNWSRPAEDNIDLAIIGTGFTFSASGAPTGGTVTGFEASQNGNIGILLSGASLAATTFAADLGLSSNNLGVFRNIMATDDTINAAEGDDYLIGFAGNDSVSGGGGNDSIDGDEEGGTSGNDTIDGGAGNDFVRALGGNDLVYGGADGDDVNGNQGEDTVFGGLGIDLVRGGQGNDIVYGEDGADIHVNGNLGNDIVYGGAGNDVGFGGQNDDQLFGEAGNDTLSGDLGNDTLTGGVGNDRFIFGGSTPGSDRITDFAASEGDLIQLPTGTTYTAATVSGNAVLTLSNGGTVTLEGIAATSVQSSWIVFG